MVEDGVVEKEVVPVIEPVPWIDTSADVVREDWAVPFPMP